MKNKYKNKFWIAYLCCSILSALCALDIQAAGSDIALQKSEHDLCDKASLQRGAKLYMNYCAGCHSLQYARYKSVAKDLGITDREGQVLETAVVENLNFTGTKATDSIVNAASKQDMENWFGKAPPDLSLVARSRGTDWLYSYLLGFYNDPSKQWGVNNIVFPDVAMPHILASLQGEQEPIYAYVSTGADISEQRKQVVGVKLADGQTSNSGTLSTAEYRQVVTDLVNFLDYIGEPHKLERKKMGVGVILFLIIFTLLAYLLKREYWKDVK